MTDMENENLEEMKKEGQPQEAAEEAEAVPADDGAKEPAKEEETDDSPEEKESEEAGEAEAGDEPEAEASEGAEEEKKRNLFKKKDKKEKKDKSAEQIAELNDKIRRQMAEFDNFRKRTEREKSQMFEIGAKSVIEKILPVVDNFERGLGAVPKESEDEPFVQGMNKVYKQMMTELESLGVKPIEAVGQEFNPDFHNAVMQVENDELESGTVAQELLKGYMYRDSVVRHSMVAVVQ